MKSSMCGICRLSSQPSGQRLWICRWGWMWWCGGTGSGMLRRSTYCHSREIRRSLIDL